MLEKSNTMRCTPARTWSDTARSSSGELELSSRPIGRRIRQSSRISWLSTMRSSLSKVDPSQRLDVDFVGELLVGEHRQFVQVLLEQLAQVAADVHGGEQHRPLR